MQSGVASNQSQMNIQQYDTYFQRTNTKQIGSRFCEYKRNLAGRIQSEYQNICVYNISKLDGITNAMIKNLPKRTKILLYEGFKKMISSGEDADMLKTIV